MKIKTFKKVCEKFRSDHVLLSSIRPNGVVKDIEEKEFEESLFDYDNLYGEYKSFSEEIPKAPRLSNKDISDIMKAKEMRKWKNTDLSTILDYAAKLDPDGEQISGNLDKMFQYISDRKQGAVAIRGKSSLLNSAFAYFTIGTTRRCALARALSLTSIPFDLSSYLGMSMPGFFFLNIAEMVVPDSVKKPVTFAKVAVGAPYFLVAKGLDTIFEHAEIKKYGFPVPLDVLNTGGTIPEEIADFEYLKEFLRESAKQNFNKRGF